VGRNGARAGAQTLNLLATPAVAEVLRSLAEGPKGLTELRRTTGVPAQTTLRAQLKRLADLRAIEKHRRSAFPGALDYELAEAGHDLVFVAEALEAWIDGSPIGHMPLGELAAKTTVKALVEAWSTSVLRVLAVRPRTLTELSQVISSVSYPSLERRLGALRLAGLVEARAANGPGNPYGVNPWLRRGVAPLIAAADWERRHRPDQTPPFGQLEQETFFLLTLPMLELPKSASGTCRLVADLSISGETRLAGVTADIERGELRACTTRSDGKPDACLVGPSRAWFGAALSGSADSLELSGDRKLARALIAALRAALFPGPAPSAAAAESART